MKLSELTELIETNTEDLTIEVYTWEKLAGRIKYRPIWERAQYLNESNVIYGHWHYEPETYEQWKIRNKYKTQT